MKNTMKKKWKVILAGLILLIVIIFISCNISPEKKIAGKWELEGTFVDFELRYGDFGEYEYFNISLSEDGVVNVFSYPVFTSGLGTCSGLGSYSFLKEKNGQYDYVIHLYTIDEKNEVHTYQTELLYNSKKDQIMLFFSENDGLLLERTDEMTTVEITTTEVNLNNYIGRYGTGEYNKYEDFFEGEVIVKDITENTIVFDINHYRLWGEDNVVALKNEQGYYYFELSNDLVCGYILFEDNDLKIDITKSDGYIVKLGETVYREINDLSKEENSDNNEEYMSEYEYKCLCSSMTSSKDLVRYEDEYVGKNFSYTGQVCFYEEDNVYVILTDENRDGIYGDNWIYAQDCRNFDKTKILEGDIITIYGKFTGVATNNYPCLKFYYADIKNIY